MQTEIDLLVLEDCVVEKVTATPATLPSEKATPTFGYTQSPTTRQLREFAVIGAIILAMMGLLQLIGGRNFILAGGYLAGALAVTCIGIARPRWLSLIFCAMMLVTWPVQWPASTLILAAIFFGLITPLGLLFRLLGRDALDRDFSQGHDSYWSPKLPVTDPRRYLKQF